MLLKLQITGRRAIVYDANRIPQPDAKLFDPEYWLRAGAVVGRAYGRGNTLILDTPYGPAVLRQYLRGGVATHFSHDRYFFWGYSRSRAVIEAHLTARLWELGLPVPQILGGMCHRHGLTYSGALLTEKIPAARTLAELMSGSSNQDVLWAAVGQCLWRFHSAGVFHADLNARNILIDEMQKVWLIDFDRSYLLKANDHRLQRNLQRLLRSLRKQNAMTEAELDRCWQQLILAYNAGLPGSAGIQGVENKVQKRG